MSALLARGRPLQLLHHRPRLFLALRRCLAASPPPMAASPSSPSRAGAHGSASEAELLARLRRIVPPLDQSAHKGSHGKVGVVGGCAEYTGAPYFAALGALRAGCDLAYVFCTRAAAPVIKSYSPELIVLPCLPDSAGGGGVGGDGGEGGDGQGGGGGGGGGGEAAAARAEALEAALDQAAPWIARLGCLVVGPGLGDDPSTIAAARLLLAAARRRGVPVVVDGSAINFVARDLKELVAGEPRCVLTPNLAEFGRLCTGAGVALRGGNDAISTAWQAQAGDLARALGGPVVVSKGPEDVVAASSSADGRQLLVCTSPASLKRSGGQGDVLTGILATLVCWTFGAGGGGGGGAAAGGATAGSDGDRLALAAWGACWLMRAASASAFAAKGRAMLAEDILDPHVADAVAKLERSGGAGGGAGGGGGGGGARAA